MSSYIELLVYFSFPSFIVLPFYNSLLWSKEQLGTLRSLKNQDLSIWCGSPATPWGAYKVTEQPTTHILLRRLGHFLSFCHWLLDQSLLSLLAPRETMSLGLYTSGAQKAYVLSNMQALDIFEQLKTLRSYCWSKEAEIHVWLVQPWQGTVHPVLILLLLLTFRPLLVICEQI